MDSLTTPTVDPSTTSKWQKQAADLLIQATSFNCVTEDDYKTATGVADRIRDGIKDWEGLFGPIKRWFDKGKKDVLAVEQSVTEPMKAALKLFKDKSLVWHQNDQRRKQIAAAAETTANEADAVARAAVAARAAAAGATTTAGAIEAAREAADAEMSKVQPTTTMTAAVKPAAGVKISNRLVIVGETAIARIEAVAQRENRTVTPDEYKAAEPVIGEDKRRALMALGAALLLEHIITNDLLDPSMARTVCKFGAMEGTFKDPQRFLEAVELDRAWLRRETTNNGANFQWPGIAVRRVEHLA